MRRNNLAWILALAAAAAPTAACAMSGPQQDAERPCRIVNGERLPAETGGARAVCAAIERAMSAKAPNLRYSAEIDVRSKSGLVATVTAGGRTVAKRQYAVMDKNLNSASVERFAASLAAEVAKVTKS